MVYVIYKENEIPGLGGVHPQDIEIGLGSLRGWNLAKCPIELVHEYAEFGLKIIPDVIAEGIIINNYVVMDDDEGMDLIPESDISLTLSTEDSEKLEAANKYIQNLEKKIQTRVKISEIKDLEDDLVDLKRLSQSLLKFLVDDWENKSESDKNESKYKGIMDEISPKLYDNIASITTVEDDVESLKKIVDLEVDIAERVNQYLTEKE